MDSVDWEIGVVFGFFECERRAGSPAESHNRALNEAADVVYIDTPGPNPASLGGSRYVVIFVDNTSRLQRSYGFREKSASDISAVIKSFVADVGGPRSFRTENETEYMNGLSLD